MLYAIEIQYSRGSYCLYDGTSPISNTCYGHCVISDKMTVVRVNVRFRNPIVIENLNVWFTVIRHKSKNNIRIHVLIYASEEMQA